MDFGFDDVAVLMTVSPRSPLPWFWIDRADDRACHPWSVLQADRGDLDYLVHPESLAVDGKYTLGILVFCVLVCLFVCALFMR